MNVNPCNKCHSTDIVLHDYNYSSFNSGGGTCKDCGNKSFSTMGCLPTRDTLIQAWNDGNPVFIPEQRIQNINKAIVELIKEKRDLIIKYNLDID